MKKDEFIVPVLFIVFNRLDTTKKVFEEIRKAKPKQLFIASDGPRESKPGEREIVEKVRKYLLDNIDWKCKVETLFREKNLGCKYAVSGAITWFFENVERGIILEDDCLPNQSFFKFCEELLEKYKNNGKIMSISGYNILGDFRINESYLFSKYGFIWGWASWRRAWKKNDLELKKYLEEKQKKNIANHGLSFIERNLLKKRAKDCILKKVNSWGIPWSVSHQMNDSFCIVPKTSLIENIGLGGKNSTHTKENKWDRKYLYYKLKGIQFPLIHPKKIYLNKKFNRKYVFSDLKRAGFKYFL